MEELVVFSRRPDMGKATMLATICWWEQNKSIHLFSVHFSPLNCASYLPAFP